MQLTAHPAGDLLSVNRVLYHCELPCKHHDTQTQPKACQLAPYHLMLMFLVTHAFPPAGMAAYAELQAQEFGRAKDGYKATTHQQFVGTGYFDLLSQVSHGRRVCSGTSNV
jgi:hypothetical protein